ncbi:MAG TPA: hypothetical protein DCZ95_19790 [Verrucomicrobia bacterium]|nr:MAG: hypothetical protein A2X46_11020 [Lentisphaerae bacterium GWF2_57_35]HBA86329.1 hypothetical protein [Verrucomicrobiota bacterium]
MRTYLTIILLLAGIAYGETISMIQVDNEYFTMVVPSSWILEVAGGKEGQMQLSLRFGDQGVKRTVSLFAHWDGLDPRRWVGTNVLSHYSIAKREYFLKQVHEKRELEIIVLGTNFIVSATIPFDLKDETFALLLNSVNTMEAK